MGQYFKIIDLDLMKCLCSLGKLGENAMDSFDDLVDMLCEVKLPPSLVAARKAPRRVGDSTSVTSVAVSFLHLPQEVIVMVFEQTETYFDALFLALTCTAVWCAGESLLRKRYLQSMAPSSGHRLINMGDYAEDLPRDLSSPSGVQELVSALGWTSERWNALPESYFDTYSEDDASESDLPVQPVVGAKAPSLRTSIRRICHCAYYKSPQVNRNRGSLLGSYKFETTDQNKLLEFSRSVRAIDGAWDWFKRSTQHPEGCMVLRNLSKKEFVRSDTFSPVGGNYHPWGFGRAIVFRITWSTDPSCNMSYEGLTRGVWAGDRFAIVGLETHEASSNASWTDVTQEVKDELIAIAEADGYEDGFQ